MWKIAIIDDDRHVLNGMKQVIPWEDIGAEWVGESTDGAAGLRLIRETKPDIVITDIYMPVLDGLKMIETLREEKYQGKFLIHSGYSDFEYARQALRLNVEDYLSKPVSRHTIREALLRAIAGIENEHRMTSEQEQLRDRLMLYEPFVRKERLKTAVTGTLDDAETMSRLFPEEHDGSHLVLGLEIVRTSRISEVASSDRCLFRFAMQNIVQEILQDDGIVFDYVELHGYHIAILFHFEKEALYAELIGRVRRLAARMIDCIRTYLQMTVRIGIGGLKRGRASLSDSLEEAFHFLSQETPKLPGPGLFEYAVDANPAVQRMHPSIRPMKFFHQMVEDVKMTQGKNIAKIVRHYTDNLQAHAALRPEQWRRLGAEFCTILSYALSDEEMHLEHMLDDRRIEAELLALRTPEEFEAWLIDKVEQVCRNQEWQENFKHKQAIEFMKAYIHENYAAELTIADLAEKVFISRNYLSQLFKNATGETINNYMIRVRMEKARGLLLEGKLKIYEIAERVGYKNIPYFSTTFKKYFGVTPAEMIK